jgi:putative addiction module component (TIGR02574 family)
MSTNPINEISKLSLSERIQLVEDIWDSIAAEPESIVVTESQKEELDRRLEKYSNNPQLGSSWDEVKKRVRDSK